MILGDEYQLALEKLEKLLEKWDNYPDHEKADPKKDQDFPHGLVDDVIHFFQLLYELWNLEQDKCFNLAQEHYAKSVAQEIESDVMVEPCCSKMEFVEVLLIPNPNANLNRNSDWR